VALIKRFARQVPGSRSAPSPVHADRRLFALGLRLLAVLALSTMAMLVKLGSESGIRLPEMMFWRQAVAVPVVLIWVLARSGLATLGTDRIFAHLRRSVVSTAGMVFTFGAIVLLPLAEAATMSFTVPIFATILSALLLKERVGVHRWGAVLAGFVGVLIVVQPGGGAMPRDGMLVGLVAALMVAIISLHLRDLGRTEGAPTTAFWFSLFSAMITGTLHLANLPGPVGAALHWGAGAHSPHQWLLLVMMGLFGGIGQMALSASLRYAPVSTVVGMDYTALIWSTLFGWLIWSVLPGPATWLGAPIIIASGLYIAWREHRLALAERTGGIGAV
jgi:drug/metabolite transporter (DMT)-like permease